MITRDTRELDLGLTAPLLTGAIREFTTDRLPRMTRVKAYYDGDHDIVRRIRAKGAANNRIAVNYPRYIVTIASGYVAGSPIDYQDETQQTALDILLEAYDRADITSLDAELANNQSLYGVGVEALYMDELARPASASVDPRNAFVVYDDTVRNDPLFGVMWIKRGANHYIAQAYTALENITFEGDSLNGLRETERKPHPFGGVPIIEYWNNGDETGDFEPVMSLIDAYDVLQSDRVNDKQQFADSLLVFTGVSGVIAAQDADDRPVGQRLREDKAISLPDTDAKVEWLTKSLNESDTQVLADSLREDIHKMALVPDLSDQNFAGNASGVAMRYKLFGLEQLCKIKERWMREALRQRMRQYAAALTAMGGASLDVERVQIVFTRGLPVNELEIAQMVSTLRGVVPDQLLLTQIPFIPDAQAAMDMLEEQRERSMERMSMQNPQQNADKPDDKEQKPTNKHNFI